MWDGIDVESQFELLYSEKRKINKRRSYDEDIYPVADLKPPPNLLGVPVQGLTVSSSAHRAEKDRRTQGGAGLERPRPRPSSQLQRRGGEDESENEHENEEDGEVE